MSLTRFFLVFTTCSYRCDVCDHVVSVLQLETAQIEACRYAKKRKDRVKHDKVMKTAAARKKYGTPRLDTYFVLDELFNIP